MPCYHPIVAYRARTGRNPETGKWPLVFSPKEGYTDMPVQIPCGQCIGCRLAKAREWAIRCVHEASLHDVNSFVTLTYSDANLPADGSLDKRALQLFMKRLRKKFGDGIRFYGCGEYGSEFQRPHYHLIIFGWFPADAVPLSPFTTKSPSKLYLSADLMRLWPFGYSSVGQVTFDSACYVARYVNKKLTGDCAEEHYQGRQPEFALMSRRPGVGHDFVEKYMSDIYPRDEVVLKDGLKLRPPSYYDNIYDKVTGHLDEIKVRRLTAAREAFLNDDYKETFTSDELKAMWHACIEPYSAESERLRKEQYQKVKLKSRQRSFENG